MSVEVFRTPEGRLEGTVVTGSGDAAPFAGTLDLLRVLEGLDLEPARPGPTGTDPRPLRDGGPA